MFEFGLTELAMIALVALLVLGPEKLPRAARTAGLYLRKARATWHSVRADIERELATEDMKKALRDTTEDMKQALRDTDKDMKQALRDTERSLLSLPESPSSETEVSAAPESESADTDEPHDPTVRD